LRCVSSVDTAVASRWLLNDGLSCTSCSAARCSRPLQQQYACVSAWHGCRLFSNADEADTTTTQRIDQISQTPASSAAGVRQSKHTNRWAARLLVWWGRKPAWHKRHRHVCPRPGQGRRSWPVPRGHTVPHPPAVESLGREGTDAGVHTVLRVQKMRGQAQVKHACEQRYCEPQLQSLAGADGWR
jgi:hypothetical protein